MTIKAQDIKFLREKTKLSISTIKNVLLEAGGDLEKAQELLNLKNIVRTHKLGNRGMDNGRLHTYLHGGKIAVMVEITCETDFAANTEEFKTFCDVVAMQIAATDPKGISRNDVPESDLDAFCNALVYQNYPEEKREQIVNNKVESWFQEVCLLEQECVHPDVKKTIEQYRAEVVAQLGENVQIKRFERWER